MSVSPPALGVVGYCVFCAADAPASPGRRCANCGGFVIPPSTGSRFQRWVDGEWQPSHDSRLTKEKRQKPAPTSVFRAPIVPCEQTAPLLTSNVNHRRGAEQACERCGKAYRPHHTTRPGRFCSKACQRVKVTP